MVAATMSENLKGTGTASAAAPSAAVDPHSEAAANLGREKFLPITRHALLDRLTHPRSWPAGEAKDARRLMRYLDYWRRHSYAASLLDLEQLYEPFSPDSDLLTTRVFSTQEKLTMQKQVVEQMRHFLVQANFEHVDPSDVKIILTKDSYYGLDLQVDLGAFEEILIFYRGATSMTERRRTAKRLFLWHEEVKIPVFILQAKSLGDVLSHINLLGRIFDRSPAADAVTRQMRERFGEIERQLQAVQNARVLYVLSTQPLITVGPDSYIHQMIGLAHGINIAGTASGAYPRLNMEAVLEKDPEVLIFPVGSTESVPESERHAWNQWTGLSAVRHRRMHVVSSDALNRPGPRVVEGLEQLARAIHPEAFRSGWSSSQP